MERKILLIDADSIIPNIALMKLSTYHKTLGDAIDLVRCNLPYYPGRLKRPYEVPAWYDKIYCSVVFNGNVSYIRGNGIEFGGTGFDLKKELPPEIEQLDCDYSIYPGTDTSYGFITRGCIRHCPFCVVPEKEGTIRIVSTVDKIIKHKKVKFLDNNILAHPNHLEILQELVTKQIRCQFNQGLDIRLITSKNSAFLSQLNYMGEYIFAFDYWKYKNIIERKLELLQWRKDWKFKMFMYVHPAMPLSDTVNRINWAKDHRILPYIMRDITCWDSEYKDFYTDIASFCNQPSLFKKLTFDEFLEKRHSNTHRIKSSSHLANLKQDDKIEIK